MTIFGDVLRMLMSTLTGAAAERKVEGLYVHLEVRAMQWEAAFTGTQGGDEEDAFD